MPWINAMDKYNESNERKEIVRRTIGSDIHKISMVSH